MTSKELMSIIVPVYNEETNIQPFYEAITAVLDQLDMNAEIIFVDDGSIDSSYKIIETLALKDNKIKSLRFSRNFGSHAAVSAGLRHAGGDAVVMISVDLQDPPTLINDFIKRWRQGYQVVWGVRESRDDPFMKKMLAKYFYALIRRIALPDYPRQGMDFGLLDRFVVDTINKFEEANRIMPPLLIWAGFKQSQILYHRGARYSGKSKWSLAERIKASIDIIVSFSYLPIRLMSYLGMVISLFSFLFAIYLIGIRVFYGLGGPGWPSVMVTVLFIGGVQLTMLGILGEYIWRTSDQVKGRPLYIIMEQIGLDKEK